MTAEEYFARAKEVHKDENLDYSKAEYKGLHEKILIIDHDMRPDGTEYGEYWQEANSHLRGCVHPRKALDKRSVEMANTTEYFIKKCTEIHNGKYSYEKTHYVNNRERVIVTCPIHGDFSIMAGNHMHNGKGCPMCGNQMSVAEEEIKDYLKEKMPNVEIISRDRSVLNGSELDIFIPSENVAIEYNGVKWHSEQYSKDKHYHLKKLEKCNENGVRLIHIFDDEYINKKEIVLSKIDEILSLKDKLPLIIPSQCVIKEAEKDETDIFLDNNDLQGKYRFNISIGCYFDDELVGIMIFLSESSGSSKWFIKRCSMSKDYNCQGLEKEILNFFIKKYNPSIIKAADDRRWVNNPSEGIYCNMGFKFDGFDAPDYTYTSGRGFRQSKYNFTKKILSKVNGFSMDMTEREMTEKLGYWRIWDCGLIRYVWKNKE